MPAGRGRLSDIEMLPDDFDDIVVWANGELRGRKRTEKDIGREFNERLLARARDLGVDVKPISPSAFNRYSVAQARLVKDLEETRMFAAAITDRMGADDTDDLTIAVAELLKSIVFRTLRQTSPEDATARDAKYAAEALKAAVSAQKISADRRRAIEEDMRKRLTKAVDAVEGEVAKTGGKADAAEVLRKIREDIYGIFS